MIYPTAMQTVAGVELQALESQLSNTEEQAKQDSKTGEQWQKAKAEIDMAKDSLIMEALINQDENKEPKQFSTSLSHNRHLLARRIENRIQQIKTGQNLHATPLVPPEFVTLFGLDRVDPNSPEGDTIYAQASDILRVGGPRDDASVLLVRALILSAWQASQEGDLARELDSHARLSHLRQTFLEDLREQVSGESSTAQSEKRDDDKSEKSRFEKEKRERAETQRALKDLAQKLRDID
ncbi:hypothetical protein HY571_02190, partial [Candidatus Micrarchaeota archaeon]|nr:hypothetical protein [Candidatus Micrarchaeota archaeon]